MASPAYNINRRFVDELWDRMKQLAESPPVPELFGSLVRTIESIPEPQQLAEIIDTAFWTSFATDEGNAITASIILMRPVQSPNTFRFDKPLPFDVRRLVKLGAALENPQADIGIWPDEAGSLQIWGFKTRTDEDIIANLWVQALGQGRVLVTFGAKNIGAVTANEAVFIEHGRLLQAVMPSLSASTDHVDDKTLLLLRYNSLLSTTRAMRRLGRGGTLLVVPDTEEWKASINMPVPYTGGANFLESEFDIAKKPSLLAPVTEFFSGLIKKKETQHQSQLFRIHNQIEKQCQRIARLTAVDGALVMTFDRFVFCFGAKIIPRENQPAPGYLKVIRPVEGDSGDIVPIGDIGGTRHQSAALFAAATPRSVAIVVSQDSDVSFFTTAPSSKDLIMVRQAELAVLHEGLGAALWNSNNFSEVGHG